LRKEKKLLDRIRYMISSHYLKVAMDSEYYEKQDSSSLKNIDKAEDETGETKGEGNHQRKKKENMKQF